jgi:hypothetical protein
MARSQAPGEAHEILARELAQPGRSRIVEQALFDVLAPGCALGQFLKNLLGGFAESVRLLRAIGPARAAARGGCGNDGGRRARSWQRCRNGRRQRRLPQIRHWSRKRHGARQRHRCHRPHRLDRPKLRMGGGCERASQLIRRLPSLAITPRGYLRSPGAGSSLLSTSRRANRKVVRKPRRRSTCGSVRCPEPRGASETARISSSSARGEVAAHGACRRGTLSCRGHGALDIQSLVSECVRCPKDGAQRQVTTSHRSPGA